jgi:DNA invertase Pin-like site-specific DNA recombinase
VKAVIYARVSTDEQTEQNQIDIVQRWAEGRGFEVVEVYREAASAWKAGHQRELARLMDDARNKKFDVVLIWALDRLTRQGPAAILNLYNTLGRYKVKVLSHEESWTEAPGELGEILLAMAGWVARMESQRRSERTKAGMERAKKEGKAIGRPKGSRDSKKRNRIGYLLREATYEQRRNYEENYGGGK